MTTLDEIAARHELVMRWWIDRDPDHVFTQPRQDVDALLNALRAVKAVAAPTGDDYTFDLGYAAALDKVRNTIREALGS